MNTSVRVLSVVAAFAMTATAAAADVIKVGVIGTMSGPFALFGQNFKMGIDAWVAQHGTKVGDHQVEFVYRDEESPNPAKSKALAQELLVKEKVQYLAGLYFAPDALAIAPLLEESKTPLVVLNAATSAIVEKSPYIVRTSFTMWQSGYPLGQWAAKQQGVKTAYTAVADYGPGYDIEASFTKGFTESGGQMAGSVRMPFLRTVRRNDHVLAASVNSSRIRSR